MQNSAVIFNMIGLLTLAMGAFIIFNTFRTIVAERRHDIGMLRAIGANRTTIISLVLSEGLVQGVVGTAIGIGLGYLLGVGIVAAMNPYIKQFMNIEMTAVVEPSLFVVSILLGVGVTLFSGLLPTLNASRVTPMEALRPSLSQAMHRVSRVGTVVGGGDARHCHRRVAHRQFCARRAGRSAGARRPGARGARVGQADRAAVRRPARAGLSRATARANLRKAISHGNPRARRSRRAQR